MIRLALGLLCIILGLIASAVLPPAENDDANDLDFST